MHRATAWGRAQAERQIPSRVTAVGRYVALDHDPESDPDDGGADDEQPSGLPV